VGEIHINPFLFQVTVTDFSLAGAGGEKLIGFHRLFVDFDLSSIWHRAYSFGVIDLDSPYVGAVMAQDGSLNLLKLQPKATSPKPKPSDKDEALPALRIGSFKVTQGTVTYEDHSHPDVFAARLEPINFELREFTTGVAGGQFTFTGASKLGERIEWHGHVSVQPLESDGEFHIDGLQLDRPGGAAEGRRCGLDHRAVAGRDGNDAGPRQTTGARGRGGADRHQVAGLVGAGWLHQSHEVGGGSGGAGRSIEVGRNCSGAGDGYYTGGERRVARGCGSRAYGDRGARGQSARSGGE
jgi:hypothetical protein